MCVVSMVGDGNKYWPEEEPISPFSPSLPKGPFIAKKKEERDYKKEIEDIIEMFTKAREYDVKNNQADCPDPTKLRLLSRMRDRIKEHGDEVLEEQFTSLLDMLGIDLGSVEEEKTK